MSGFSPGWASSTECPRLGYHRWASPTVCRGRMAVDRTHPQGSAARRLLQQRDLPSVVEVMLHHAVEQDVYVVRLARHGPFEVLDTKLADRLQERRVGSL